MVIPLAYRFLSLLRNQWLSLADIQAIQRAKLQRLIAHAYDKVPYYRRLFDAMGIRPEDIREPDDLSKLPITTKAQILTHPSRDLVASGIDPAKCIKMRTSGSQGMPVEVLFKREDKAGWGLLALRG